MASIGKNALVKTGTASTETDISAYLDEIEWPLDGNDEDTTVFGTTNDETSVPTTQKSEIKVTGNWDATIDGIMRPLLLVAGKSLVYAPLGNSASPSGTPRRSCLGYWKQFAGPKQTAKGKITFTATFVKSGAATYDTVP